MPAFADMVTIGRVIKPQGRHGELAVASFSDRPERFPTLAEAWVEGPGGAARRVTITRCWPHKGRFVLKLEGVDSIEAAEGYRGLELRISDADLPALPAGSYYHHELIGLRVVDESGRALGFVASLLEGAGDAPVLVIRDGPAEILLPLADAFVQRIDLTQRQMVAQIPEPYAHD